MSSLKTTITELKNLILQRHLQPGDAIPTESELCEILNVSRSSVREAVRTLTALDILDVRHGRGTFVGQMSLQPLVDALVFRAAMSATDDLKTLREIVEIRRSIDKNAGPELISSFKNTSNPELKKLVEKMVSYAATGRDISAFDQEFHNSLARRIDNTMQAQFIEAFWKIHSVINPLLEISTPDNLEVTAQAHGDILTALEKGDLEEYIAAVNKHYQPILDNLERTNRNLQEKL
ncbi:transcriptional regulator, GntR family [Gleimia coleocanis DSM 15436]|uniref:Transcriptional regulator, GntR family n=1 Tax=Gleimia coleocanis DSM 15436 TaxID=525245 RepID=C0W2A0_9ACTO|nr:GntR family transcriptional regulator [Gleimia coleocanis]EEH63205.1 transcriptional regulator, GntR family [Gleimia coleocanis DSM 15436]